MNVIAKATALALVIFATTVAAQEVTTVTGVVTTRADGLSLPGMEAVDQIYDAEWVTDLELSYRYNQTLFGFGVQNLANVFPDQNLLAVSNRGGRTFPRNAPFGFNGRYFYGKITHTF